MQPNQALIELPRPGKLAVADWLCAADAPYKAQRSVVLARMALGC